MRRALWLRFGPARHGHSPNTAAAAAAVGISRRQLERWAAGHATPTPASAARLRAALAPAPDVLRREADEAHDADTAAKDTARSRGREITTTGNVWSTLDLVVVPHRFAAIQIRHHVLDDVQAWRVQIHSDLMPTANTKTWLDTAPDTNLTDTAHHLGYR